MTVHEVHFPVRFEASVEDQPGPLWKARFDRYWPAYRTWFLRTATVGRPTYLDCRRAMRQHMPELVPVWESLVDLAGGGDVEARFLSLWCPPPYIGGCTQAVWLDPTGHEEPALLRNYDYAPALLEGNWVATRWLGPRVVAMSDCLWGALDGINEAGLACSLSFGGRAVSGQGFGVPLVLRYVLEMATTTREAVRMLERLPVSTTYSITMLDRQADWATVFVAPDRKAEVVRQAVVTNHQRDIEWPEHAKATRSVERQSWLAARVAQPGSAQDIAMALMSPPMVQDAYQRGYGTLYTASYRPRSGAIGLLWPGSEPWMQSVADFKEGQRDIVFPPPPAAVGST
ncbi:C45 family autoproteolytic acyltransferase/hydolase [Polaromonas jejuensis]|uniref:C45 family autoproteolytic acyltransferase/hydrolase n=1 Tax=Polaromonas jejuensis TaxID=457502 RepID=A0ABW0QD10_9BURK|nr:C45 family peptidase [Polaromonas jejuensis]